MALNIKNRTVEALACEVASMAEETKTEAVRVALEERRERLRLQGKKPRSVEDIVAYLEREVWPKVPPELLGVGISQEEQDEILGYGPEGV